MHPYYQQLYVEGIMNNDKAKQAEFIVQYSKDLFWILQSFLTSRIKPFHAKVGATYQSDKSKIECLEDPFAVTDQLQFDIMVGSPDRIKTIFESICALKQLQLVKIKPEFTKTKKEVEIFYVFSKKITVKMVIKMLSYTIHEEQ